MFGDDTEELEAGLAFFIHSHIILYFNHLPKVSLAAQEGSLSD